MDIPASDWGEACGSYVIDEYGRLWRITGFLDRPTVILDPVETDEHPDRVKETREREYLVMGSPNSRAFRRLIPEA